MNPAVARIFAVTFIVVALLATAAVMAVFKAGDIPLAAVCTALGAGIPLVLGWLTKPAADSASPDAKGKSGTAAVLLVAGGVFASQLTGCGAITPAVEQSLEQGVNQAGIAILCSIEEEELDDPALNQDCEKLSAGLTAPQRAAIARHASRAAARKAAKPDAGADGGAK